MWSKIDAKLLLLKSSVFNGWPTTFNFALYKNNQKKNNLKLKDKYSQKPSYYDSKIVLSKEPLFKKILKKNLQNYNQELICLTDNYMNHKFNLLGSGWLNSDRKESKINLITDANKDYSNKLIETLPKRYRRINWSKDFIENFEWDNSIFFSDIKIKSDINADIKRPWELSRFYHLAHLAFMYNLSHDEKFKDEGQNQLIDFISSCPPCFGCNWFNAMEVGIRAINILFFLDQVGAENFEQSFLDVITNSIEHHLNFIISQLEWTTIARSNHYLANITALIVMLSKIERNNDHEGLLHWLKMELHNELGYQFHYDGSNYEGSTGYHRLSSELIFIGLNSLESINLDITYDFKHFAKKNIFKLPHFKNINNNTRLDNKKIGKMVQFLEVHSMNGNDMIQIGDMDSGRVLKLTPLYDKSLSIENHLNSEVVSSLLEIDNKYLESQIFKKSVKQVKANNGFLIRNVEPSFLLSSHLNQINNNICYQWPSEKNLLDNKSFHAFKNFGLYTIKSDNLFLSIRCGLSGQNGVGGHNHNDQLSISLKIGNNYFIKDPGSYVYTSDPKLRNKYRSASSHFCPYLNNKEPADFNTGLFRLNLDYKAKCLYFDGKQFIGFHDAYGDKMYRHIKLMNHSIIVTDYFEGSTPIEHLNLINGFFIPSVKHSVGYGQLES